MSDNRMPSNFASRRACGRRLKTCRGSWRVERLRGSILWNLKANFHAHWEHPPLEGPERGAKCR